MVAASTLADVWRRHVLDSAQLAPLIPPQARTIADLGSGAGFPGMVLAIMLSPPPPSAGEGDHDSSAEALAKAEVVEGAETSLTVHLIESTQKKCRFLEEVAAATGASVQVHWARTEQVENLKADIVMARALAPLDRLLTLAHPFFGPATIGLFLKGRSLNDELTAATKSWRLAATHIPSRSDPSGTVLRVTGLTPWRSSRKQS